MSMDANTDNMTRDHMQSTACVIDDLVTAAMDMLCIGEMSATQDAQDAFSLLEMAKSRARQLNRALDDLNAPEDLK